MRLFLPAAALVVAAGSLSAPAQAQQRATLPANVIGSGPATAARTSALSAWTKVTDVPQKQRNGGFTVLNGKLYVYGGSVFPAGGSIEFTKQVQVYDLAANTWSRAADLPYLITANGGVAKDGLLYNLAGAYVDQLPGKDVSLVYNPATNAWAKSTFPEYPSAGWIRGSFLRGWIAPDGKIYINDTGLGAAILDPVINQWTISFGPPQLAEQSDWQGTAMVMDAAGLVHAFGGGVGSFGGAGFLFRANTRHAVYNPATNTWASAAPLPIAKVHATAVLGSDGNLYVLGGGISTTTPTTDVQIYNPTTNTWSTGPALPTTIGIEPVATVGNDIYFATQGMLYKATVTVAGITWTGGVSNSWTDAGNWSGGAVPTATDDVTIPAGLSRYPSISTGTPTAHTVTVASGAQLSLADGGTLSLTGNLLNNGTFASAGSGSLAFIGTTAQTLGGTATTTLQNLVVGAAGATLAGPVTVQRQLTLTGNLTTTGQRLVLASSSAGTALVVNSGGVVTGPTTVQRYIDPSTNAGFGYRHFSSAVSGATVGTLAVTGSGAVPVLLNAAYNTAADPSLVTPFPTAFSYDQSRVTTDFGVGWMSPAATSAELPRGKGLTIQQLAGTTFEVTGPQLNTGVITLDSLSRGSGSESGWHLIGNPYPSPIDWNRVSRNNMEAAAYVYRSTGAYDGGYMSYVNGVGSNVIPQGQAFFVRVATPNTSSGRLSFTDASREMTYTSPGYARPASAETRPLVQLSVQRAGTTDAASQDVFYVYEQAGATTGFDAGYDAVKVQLNGGRQPSLYQVVGTQSLAIQGLPAGNTAQRLNLGVHAPEAGSYVFSAAQLLNLPATEPVWLQDQLTGQWHDLRQGSYTVSLSPGLSTTRFVLHLHQATILGSKQATSWAGELQLYPNPASSAAAVAVVASGVRGSSAKLVLLNTVGQIVRQQSLAVAGQEVRSSIALAGLAPGIYSVQVRSQNGVLTRQLVIQ